MCVRQLGKDGRRLIKVKKFRLEQSAATHVRSPRRCSTVPEHRDYRQLLIKRYRIIFHIVRQEVIIDTIVYPYQMFRPDLLLKE